MFFFVCVFGFLQFARFEFFRFLLKVRKSRTEGTVTNQLDAQTPSNFVLSQSVMAQVAAQMAYQSDSGTESQPILILVDQSSINSVSFFF